MPDKIYTNIGDNQVGFDTLADHYLINKPLYKLIESTNTGIWERSITTNDAWWSPKFCELLGYNYGEIETNYLFFLNKIVHPNDVEMIYTAFQSHLKNQTPYKIEYRLLTKNQGYRWFEVSGKAWPDHTGQLARMIGAIVDIDAKKHIEINLRRSEFLLRENNKIAHIGGWEMDVETREIFFSKEVNEIFELDSDRIFDLPTAINFFEPGYRELIVEAIDNAIEHCKAYDLELILKTAKDNIIWVRTKGVPVVDEHGHCVTLRGIFQNINDTKIKELDLHNSLNLLSDQNKRLQNFAHIVSHNLRSHTGNLQFMVNLFEEVTAPADQKEVFNNIRSISESLANTIDHLNQIVKIQTEINNEKKELYFKDFFNNSLNAIENNIAETGATVNVDFSACPVVNYVPAYLESIFLNLLTNALKYRHPDRKPQISCKTYLELGHTYLTFADNGLGIDLKKHGDKLFGMYKTFHKNANAKGIGLFITRNQVESLGGTIKVESTVNVGTTFIIKLI
ncbi:PAS domain S-box-containing protein [Mucilaginibacter gracilis]|uniref:histidine kinase n=1 Tax=Mucilaginibacter gracilis TaxID=423350 RepID=A0A495JA24_9SPHI|nr:PAS domain-containing sensor histidine kinase [Mucilaginibacter gracilis]RKR85551.1 PAS domain S-box-containing protein [Mucilaginibacter gracilis]